jgi:hypothetical protein
MRVAFAEPNEPNERDRWRGEVFNRFVAEAALDLSGASDCECLIFSKANAMDQHRSSN